MAKSSPHPNKKHPQVMLHSEDREEFYKAKNFFFVITTFKTIPIFEGSLVLTVYI